jgi:cytochrome c oxidase cbb3-type subunit 1
MAGTEWLDTVLSMRPYWFVRTLGGISMDIGMSLLVINLMMTALTSPAREAERPAYGTAPVPAGGAA